jgi:hypothetical protein
MNGWIGFDGLMAKAYTNLFEHHRLWSNHSSIFPSPTLSAATTRYVAKIKSLIQASEQLKEVVKEATLSSSASLSPITRFKLIRKIQTIGKITDASTFDGSMTRLLVYGAATVGPFFEAIHGRAPSIYDCGLLSIGK